MGCNVDIEEHQSALGDDVRGVSPGLDSDPSGEEPVLSSTIPKYRLS